MRAPVVFLCFLALACGQLDRGDGNDGADDSVARFVLTEEWQVGGAVDTTLNLSSISRVAPAPSGGLSIVQMNITPIITLNADGTLRHTLGRSGDGPGEWTSYPPPSMIGWFDEVFKVVAGNRVHSFDSDGSLIGTELVQPPPGWDRARVIGVLAGEHRIGLVRSATSQERPAPEVLLHWQADGTVADSVTSMWGSETVMQVSLDGPGVTMVRPFGIRSRVALGTDGNSLLVVDSPAMHTPDSATFSLRKIAPAGQVVWEHDVVFDPSPPTPEAVADTVRHISQGLHERFPDRAQAWIEGQVSDAVGAPTMIPPVARALLAASGDTWIERHADENPGARVWEVRGADGLVRGELRVPVDVILLAVDEAVVWTVTHDEFGVPVLAKNQLGREPPQL
ncbi:MAG: hypothetical protein WD960_01220 [Gemmatimonadota bacterium]